MGRDDWGERQVAGVKAKRSLHYKDRKDAETPAEKVPALLLISPNFKRIQTEMVSILAEAGKQLESEGVELYRQAVNRLSEDLKGKVIGLLISDQVEDCYAVTPGEFPMWKDTVLKYQEDYIGSWIDRIADGQFPSTLTVITYFRRSKGKMSEEEIERIEEEFEELAQSANIRYKPCQTQEEVNKVVDKDIISAALQQQQQKDKMKTLMRGRNQLLQKAKKLTQDAIKRR